jgi:hypothetical protein
LLMPSANQMRAKFPKLAALLDVFHSVVRRQPRTSAALSVTVLPTPAQKSRQIRSRPAPFLMIFILELQTLYGHSPIHCLTEV